MKNNFLILLVAAACCVVTSIALTTHGQSNLLISSKLAPASPAATLLTERSSPPPTTLCADDEQVIFSCTLEGSGKFASLCGSKRLTRVEGYLQYRFGRSGNVELEFPTDRKHSQQRFAYEHYFREQFDETEISFENGGYRYTLFDYYHGEQGAVRKQRGVKVKVDGQDSKETTLRCQSHRVAHYADLPEILGGQ